MNTLIESLKKVKDFRRSAGTRHPLWLVLLIVILGTMAGHQGYRAWGNFAKYNKQYLVQTFKIYPIRVPSNSTIRRVLLGVSTSDLLKAFNEWCQELLSYIPAGDGVAFDGKTLRNTVTDSQESSQNWVALVSAFSQATGLVLKLRKFEAQKGSEIHYIQEMLRDYPALSQILTLDALHCQKLTNQLISESGNDYIIPVKKNQINLYKQIENISESQEPDSEFEEDDISHGREIYRQVSVFYTDKNPKCQEKIKSWGWDKVQSLIRVERWGFRGDEPYQNTRYYISSLSVHAQLFAEKIRNHWQIENRLHWVKDVIFNEDNSPIKSRKPATNISILQTIALNLFRFLGFLSVTEGSRWLNGRLCRLSLLLE